MIVQTLYIARAIYHAWNTIISVPSIAVTTLIAFALYTSVACMHDKLIITVYGDIHMIR